MRSHTRRQNVVHPLKNPIETKDASLQLDRTREVRIRQGQVQGNVVQGRAPRRRQDVEEDGGKSKPKSKASKTVEAEDAPVDEPPKKRRRKRARPGVGPDEKNIN